MSVKHTFVNPLADDPLFPGNKPSDWNADHDLSELVASDVTDFSEAVDDRVATLLVAGTNITLTYDDMANTLTIDAASGGGVIGSDMQIPFNQGGFMNGDANLTWDYNSGTFHVGSNGTYVQSGFFGTLDAENPANLQVLAGSSTSIDSTKPGAQLTIKSGNGSSPTIDDGTNGGDGGQAGFVAGSGGSPVGVVDANGGRGGDALCVGGGGGAGIGAGTNGNGGDAYCIGGDPGGAGALGGNCFLGAGTGGQTIFQNLPTSDPGISGAIWLNSNVLTISP